MKKRKLFFLALFIILGIGSAWGLYAVDIERDVELSPYPWGKNFAFTITDDPDFTKLERIKPVYDFLDEIGLRTTIAVWVKEASRSNGIPDIAGHFNFGDTCQRKDYLLYMKYLQRRGFEIALHTVSGGNDYRERTIEGYEEFKTYFGDYPKINIMHSNNLENIYWGTKVVENRFLRYILGLVYKSKSEIPFTGEEPESPYFWGDILKEKTKYTRLWGTSDINTLKYNSSMPYHNPKKPYVNYWFSFSDGYLLKWFKQLISDENIKKLVRERGTSIVYTHFARFVRKDSSGKYRLDEDSKRQMLKIASLRDGWFVPASVLLDRLLLMKNIKLLFSNNAVTVANLNNSYADGVTILVKPGIRLYKSDGKLLEPNEEREIVLGKMYPGQALVLLRNKDHLHKSKSPRGLEYFNLIFQRVRILLFSHRG